MNVSLILIYVHFDPISLVDVIKILGSFRSEPCVRSHYCFVFLSQHDRPPTEGAVTYDVILKLTHEI
jgi:hypothetical protein